LHPEGWSSVLSASSLLLALPESTSFSQTDSNDDDGLLARIVCMDELCQELAQSQTYKQAGDKVGTLAMTACV